MKNPTTIKIATEVSAPVHTVWDVWNTPEHIVNWSAASPDWHTTEAAIDLREGGQFNSRMEAKDGSTVFDFTGTFDRVKAHEHLAYTLADGRKVSVDFRANGNTTTIEERFEAENINSRELQQQGWQAILDNFKKYTESL
jgi:uncharacterized protein YndB with AHSA1/START domain|tara:strand:+ start:372 stop:791 length:420 start_codon:yes stop_codon:yes gene_type:complete